MMNAPAQKKSDGWLARALGLLILVGFSIYALAAPHSIAISWVGISIVILAWIVRTITTRQFGIKRSPLDLPLWLFIGWTVLSAFFSVEPRISIAKLINVSTFLFFYLTQATLTRKTAALFAALMIVSSSAGVLWGAGELVVGRGVIVNALSDASILRSETRLQPGDVVWRVNGRRVSSVAEIDALIRSTPAGQRASLSVISHGEHVEWRGPLVTEPMRSELSPSGISGGGRSHNFRASGWTRHYETFAEVIQMIAQLALGFAFVGWLKTPVTIETHRRFIVRPVPAAIAFTILAIGIVLTAMRTTLVALALGMFVMAWRATASKRTRAVMLLVAVLIVGIGGIAIWRTRATGALLLRDPSASLRMEVAEIAARRIILHPLLGHGMDAMHKHWNEWDFPGEDMLDAHSTPIQIAFDRGLPALVFWLWLMFAFWKFASSTEVKTRNASPLHHGLALGICGGVAGFFASSLVNYNFGDSEVALLLWWMMGATVVILDATPLPSRMTA